MNYFSYTIKSGDTLETISQTFGMPQILLRLFTLCSVNKLSKEDLLFPGMEIKVRGNPKLSTDSVNTEATITEIVIVPKIELNTPCYLCLEDGLVPGVLKGSVNQINFVPLKCTYDKCKKLMEGNMELFDLSEFETVIDLRDIIKFKLKFQNCIKFELSNIETEERSQNPIPRVAIYIKLHQTTSEQIIKQVVSEINKCIQQKPNIHGSYVTKVPHFDLTGSYTEYLIDENNKPDQLEDLLINKREIIRDFLEEVIQIEIEYIERQLQMSLDYKLPRIHGSSNLIDENMRCQLVLQLPHPYNNWPWRLIYSISEHGSSLTKFYLQCQNYDSTVIIMKDDQGYIFGGFASQQWVIKRSFYGDGRCFLFSFKDEQILETFFASGMNEFYMMSDRESISMGSGGQHGFFISKDILQGSSGTSQTYQNPQLSYKDHFYIIDMEVWALD